MAPNITQAVLLVGGEGTRLRPLTHRRPKALIPLLNQPLLSYEFSLLARHGITDIVLAVGYKADALRRALGDGEAWGARLHYVEDPMPLGTAGAIKNVAHLLDGPFIAMNGDLVYDVDLSAVMAAHLRSGAAITFCLRKVADISRYGLIECDDDGWVTAFKEKQTVDETGRNTVNSGLYVMSPEALDFIPEGREFSNEHELFPDLLRAGKPLLGHVPEAEGYWADVGTTDAYLQTSRDLLAGAVSWTKPATDPSATISPKARLEAPVHIADGVTIADGASVGPNVTIGPCGAVAAGSRLVNSILWERVTVGESCSLENVVVADGVLIPDSAQQNGGAIVP
jgi:mannose-1-phosphate guanylyltransferase